MTKGIKAKGIRDFEKYAGKLVEVIKRINEYNGDARIFVAPDVISLMAGFPMSHTRMGVWIEIFWLTA